MWRLVSPKSPIACVRGSTRSGQSLVLDESRQRPPAVIAARRPTAAYEQALGRDPRHVDAANGLGTLLVQAGRPGEAIAWFERALETEPDFHEARLNLGIAYQESGQREKAAEAYRTVLKAPDRFKRERAAARKLLAALSP
jgi:Tfp pilus assembly protein PilF